MRELLFAWLLCSAACTVESPCDRQSVADRIASRAGATIRPESEDAALPPGISLADGLSSDEAAAIALWNNPDFQAVLADLQVSRAEFATAGAFRNPLLTMLFPLDGKQFEATLAVPLDALLQRPQRIAVARLDVERVANDLVRAGLDLVRDTHLAFSAGLFAAERTGIAATMVELADRRAVLAGLRHAAGDSSELETLAANLEAARARREASRAAQEAARANAHLCGLLGLPADHPPVVLVPPDPPPDALPAKSELLAIAAACRPDLHAAEVALVAAGERVGMVRAEVWQVALLADMNAVPGGRDQIGPGLTGEVPLFDRRQGALARVDAEVERAALRLSALRHRIEQQVEAALVSATALQAECNDLSRRQVPASTQEVALTERLVAAGEAAEEALLLAQQRQQEIGLELASTVARLRDARTALAHAIGRRIGP